MSTAITSATPISRNTQPKLFSSFALRALPLSWIAVGAALMLAACASTPPEPKAPALAAAPEPLVCPPAEKPICPEPPPAAAAQLVSRHWIITDADNQVQDVRGMGVVGEQPVLKPGDTFEYSSGSSIPTAVGTMRGSYQLVAEDGTRFEASIPEFTLSVPRVLH